MNQAATALFNSCIHATQVLHDELPTVLSSSLHDPDPDTKDPASGATSAMETPGFDTILS